MRRFKVDREYEVIRWGRHDIVVLDAVKVDGQAKAFCPFCTAAEKRGRKVYHLHGVGEGERGCHCCQKDIEIEMPSGRVVSNELTYSLRLVMPATV